MDLVSHGGWNITLEYNRYMAKKFSDDSFKLGLGKCF